MNSATLSHILDPQLLNIRRHDKAGRLIKQVDIGSLGHYTFKPTQTNFSYSISRRKQIHQDIIANKLYIEAYLKEEQSLLGWELGTIAPASLRLQILEANPIIYQKSTATLESEDR